MWKDFTIKQKLIFTGIILGLIGFVIGITLIDGNEEDASLNEHAGLSNGVIIKLIHGRGTNFINSNVQFCFKIKGKTKIDYQPAIWGITWDSLIGKSFPVIYDTTSPNINHLLIFPEDFKTWNISFPDSLNWVLKFNSKYK